MKTRILINTNYWWNLKKLKLDDHNKSQKMGSTKRRLGDDYEILGLPNGTKFTADELKRAYKRRALELHPDKRPAVDRSSATAQFQKLQSAYENLLSSSTTTTAASASTEDRHAHTHYHYDDRFDHAHNYNCHDEEGKEYEYYAYHDDDYDFEYRRYYSQEYEEEEAAKRSHVDRTEEMKRTWKAQIQVV